MKKSIADQIKNIVTGAIVAPAQAQAAPGVTVNTAPAQTPAALTTSIANHITSVLKISVALLEKNSTKIVQKGDKLNLYQICIKKTTSIPGTKIAQWGAHVREINLIGWDNKGVIMQIWLPAPAEGEQTQTQTKTPTKII